MFKSFGVLIDECYTYSDLTLGWCPGWVTSEESPLGFVLPNLRKQTGLLGTGSFGQERGAAG